MAKWLSIRFQTKWFWVKFQLQSLKLQIFAPASSKEFPDIKATIECGLTLKRVRDMTKTYSLSTDSLMAHSPAVIVSLIHLMHAISRAHSSTRVTSLMRVKNSSCHFFYDTYCLEPLNEENERKVRCIKLNSQPFFFDLC